MVAKNSHIGWKLLPFLDKEEVDEDEKDSSKIITAAKKSYIRVCHSEVHKVPEPANLVRRNFWKISLLAENFDQNPRVENAEIFCPQNIFCLH